MAEGASGIVCMVSKQTVITVSAPSKQGLVTSSFRIHLITSLILFRVCIYTLHHWKSIYILDEMLNENEYSASVEVVCTADSLSDLGIPQSFAHLLEN